jgi:Short C-terminal domain
MIGRTWTAVTTATPAVGLLASLMFTPLVVDAASVRIDSPVGAPVSLTAHDVDTESPIPSPTVVRAGQAPTRSRSIGGYPLRRRRHIHFWMHNWTHAGTGTGPISWIVLGPLLAIVLGVTALPFYLRARRRRKQARRDTGDQPVDYAPPTLGTVDYTPPTLGTEVLTPQQTPTVPVSPAYAPAHAEQPDDRLSRLSALHASGALTDEEFETQRRHILGE